MHLIIRNGIEDKNATEEKKNEAKRRPNEGLLLKPGPGL